MSIKRLLLIICVTLPTFAKAKPDSAYLYILGVAQDAGYPQAGCYQTHCMPGWENKTLQRGATSIALIDPVAKTKILFEATPNLPQQLYNLEQEAPSSQYTFEGVFLTHAHIGHYAGLMFFGHEAMGSNNIPVYAMPKMAKYLAKNGPWSQLVDYGNISLRGLQHNQALDVNGITITPFLVPHRDEFSETVGYLIEGPSKTAVFIPDINKWSVWDTDIAELITKVDYALLDATFFDDGELPGRDMSKVPHPLVTETMQRLGALSIEQRGKVWFIHMNHTNPLLDADSQASKRVRAAGFNITSEGIRLEL
jgi:pyrroloquinoline quinone biosynthesis protein B